MGESWSKANIEHIVVLMMENRSFDHMLGYLKHPQADRFPGVRDPLVTNTWHVRGKPSQDIEPTALHAMDLAVDPDHSFEEVHRQVYGTEWAAGQLPGDPTMGGFIDSYYTKLVDGAAVDPPRAASAPEVMRCWEDSDERVLSWLAREFAVFGRWFASVPADTWPNRNFAHAASSGTETDNAGRTYTMPTIFEQIPDDWRIYFDGLAQSFVFENLWDEGRFSRFTKFQKHVASTEHGHDGTKLARYTFIEPNHGLVPGFHPANSQHPWDHTVAPGEPPKHDSFTLGEQLIADVYNTLVAHPKVFAKTLLLITYDEHGGFYDHVAPIERSALKPAENGFDFSRSGVRVPTVAVSPLLSRGQLVLEDYDHASIPRTVRDHFAPGKSELTHRDRDANNFLDELEFGPPRELSPYRAPHLRGLLPPTPEPEEAAPVPSSVVFSDMQQQLLATGQAMEAHFRRRRGALPMESVPLEFESPVALSNRLSYVLDEIDSED